MMKRYRPGILPLTFAAALLTSTVALAGLKSYQYVYIDLVNHSAIGDLGAVRNSSDSSQRVGCSIVTNGVGGNVSGHCWAGDTAGNYVDCGTVDPDMLATIRSLHGDSRLFFSWGSSVYCSSIWVGNYSDTAPKN
jgi:hypothetical protein